MIQEKIKFLDKLMIALFLFSTTLSVFIIIGPINNFFEPFLGEYHQAIIEAPITEEILKTTGLLILASASLRLKNFEFFNSLEFGYITGYSIGILIGIFENIFSYETFSGFRVVTPFSHAIETGIVGIGIYYLASEGRKGLVKLVLTFLISISIHSIWNMVGLATPEKLPLYMIQIMGTTVTVMGLTLILIFFNRLLREETTQDSSY